MVDSVYIACVISSRAVNMAGMSSAKTEAELPAISRTSASATRVPPAPTKPWRPQGIHVHKRVAAPSFTYDSFWRSAWAVANASTPLPLSGRVPRVYVYRLPESSPLTDQRDPREYSHRNRTVNEIRLKWDSRYGTLGTNPERSVATPLTPHAALTDSLRLLIALHSSRCTVRGAVSSMRASWAPL